MRKELDYDYHGDAGGPFSAEKLESQPMRGVMINFHDLIATNPFSIGPGSLHQFLHLVHNLAPSLMDNTSKQLQIVVIRCFE